MNIDAKSDLGGEMQHRLGAGERAVERIRVAHVSGMKFNIRRRRPARAMDIGSQRIEHANLVPARHKLFQHMLADEARAAGQENLHRRYTAIRIVSSTGSGVPPA